jgi:hypothetical protein
MFGVCVFVEPIIVEIFESAHCKCALGSCPYKGCFRSKLDLHHLFVIALVITASKVNILRLTLNIHGAQFNVRMRIHVKNECHIATGAKTLWCFCFQQIISMKTKSSLQMNASFVTISDCYHQTNQKQYFW